MSTKKKGARLWFETQSEIEAYDDLMMSNMELKSEDFDDPNFTITSNRPKKERMPSISTKVKQQLAKIEAFILSKHQNRSGEHLNLGSVSLLTDKLYYMKMAFLGFPVSYLLIRELPFRSFYFRAFIMSVFLSSYFRSYGPPIPFFREVFRQPKTMGSPGSKKETYIFDWIRQVETNRPMNLEGEGMLFTRFITELYLWVI